MVHRGRSQATQAAHTPSRQMRLYTGREAVRVDVGPYQHKALEHAERRVRTYGKALLGLASLLCLSVCGNLVCSALSILVFKESQFTDTIPQRPVGWIERFGDFYAHASLHVILPEDPDPPSPVPPPRPPHATKQEVENMFSWGYPLLSDSGLKSCAIALSGTEACWELTDPAMTDIPEDFLQGNTDLTGTLKVGPAVKTIGASAFATTPSSRTLTSRRRPRSWRSGRAPSLKPTLRARL